VFTARGVTDVAAESFCVEENAVETRAGDFSRKICPPPVYINQTCDWDGKMESNKSGDQFEGE